jgi:phenylacetate-CoA ligase
LGSSAGLRERVPLWQDRIPLGFDLARDWAFLPTTRREDLAARIELCVPDGEPAGSAHRLREQPDLYVEIVDAEGLPVPEGARGEIAVSAGRNPFLPLLRYRTGDFARLVFAEGEPQLLELEGRPPVAFRAADGSPLNSVDVGRALRQSFAVVQHEFVQRADGSCEAVLRPAFGAPLDLAAVARELQALFGQPTHVEVRIDAALGLERKAVPYRSELPREGV